MSEHAVQPRRILCDATPERVFAVLADPRAYARFVVGTRTIRRFDPDWPQPRSVFHHSLGFGVTVIRDTTESLQAEPPHRLVLQPGMRPLSVNVTTFRLTPHEGGTCVAVEERTVGGPATAVAPLADRLLSLRNVVLLRRLRAVVEEREKRRRLVRGDPGA